MSQREPYYIDLGDNKFCMYMLPPMQSHRLLMAVAKMIGPSFGPVIDMVFSAAKKSGKDIMDQDVGADFFSRALGSLFSDLDEGIIDKLISAFSEVSEVDGKPMKGIFDFFFMGNLDLMYKWLAWGCKVQWEKSLSVLVDIIKTQGAKTQVLKS